MGTPLNSDLTSEQLARLQPPEWSPTQKLGSLGEATAKRGGFLGLLAKLGRGFAKYQPAISRGTALLASAAGNEQPLQQEMASEQASRQNWLDKLQQAIRVRQMKMEEEQAERARAEETRKQELFPLQKQEIEKRLARPVYPTAPLTTEQGIFSYDPEKGTAAPVMAPAEPVVSPPKLGAPPSVLGDLFETAPGTTYGTRPPQILRPYVKPDTGISEMEAYIKAAGGDVAKALANRQADEIAARRAGRAAGAGGATENEQQAEAENYADALEAGTIQWPQVPVTKGLRNRVMGVINSRGAIVLTAKQREGLQSSERAKGIIDSIDEASKKVHSGAWFPGQKWVSGAAETAASVGAPAGNPDLDALQAGAAALGPIIRNLGEMGNLSEGDIQRAQAAVPVSRFLTRQEAESRLKILREFVSASKNAIRNVAGKPSRDLLQEEGGAPPPAVVPLGATAIAPGDDGKDHYINAQGQDLGVVP